MKRIDAHLHPNFLGIGIHDLIARLDADDMDSGWLLTWEEYDSKNPDYQHLDIDSALDMCREKPERFVPWYAPDPTRPDAIKRLHEYAAKGIAGCGELKVSVEWKDPRLTPYLATLEQIQLPLVFHMEAPWTDIRPRHILDRILYRLGIRLQSIRVEFPGYLHDFDGLEQRLAEFPNLAFIGHGPLFWKGLSSDWKNNDALFPTSPVNPAGITHALLRDYPNCYADLSARSGYNALARDRKFARKFLLQTHTKILYGTDNMNLGLKQLLESLALPQDVLFRILGGNAQRLLQKADTCA